MTSVGMAAKSMRVLAPFWVFVALKIGGRNTNNLRSADDTTLMAESEKELKSLLMSMKESERAGLKLN